MRWPYKPLMVVRLNLGAPWEVVMKLVYEQYEPELFCVRCGHNVSLHNVVFTSERTLVIGKCNTDTTTYHGTGTIIEPCDCHSGALDELSCQEVHV